jgi:hypothetical protein
MGSRSNMTAVDLAWRAASAILSDHPRYEESSTFYMAVPPKYYLSFAELHAAARYYPRISTNALAEAWARCGSTQQISLCAWDSVCASMCRCASYHIISDIMEDRLYKLQKKTFMSHIECRDQENMTPLLAAVANYKWGIAMFLLDHGANPNAQMTDESLKYGRTYRSIGFTALHTLCCILARSHIPRRLTGMSQEGFLEDLVTKLISSNRGPF